MKEYLNFAIAKFGACATCRRVASMEKMLCNVPHIKSELFFYKVDNNLEKHNS